LLLSCLSASSSFFFFLHSSPPEIYTLSLHDALPISPGFRGAKCFVPVVRFAAAGAKFSTSRPATRRIRSTTMKTCAACSPMRCRSEEHTSELQSRENLVCRLLLEKKKKDTYALRTQV